MLLYRFWGDNKDRLAYPDFDTIKGIKTGVIATKQTKDMYKCDNILIIGSLNNIEEIASNLFDVLRRCDSLEISQVFVEAFDEDGVGMAIMNRLKKAAGYNIINV